MCYNKVFIKGLHCTQYALLRRCVCLLSQYRGQKYLKIALVLQDE